MIKEMKCENYFKKITSECCHEYVQQKMMEDAEDMLPEKDKNTKTAYKEIKTKSSYTDCSRKATSTDSVPKKMNAWNLFRNIRTCLKMMLGCNSRLSFIIHIQRSSTILLE